MSQLKSEGTLSALKRSPNKAVIQELEELLERAKTGEVQALVYFIELGHSSSFGSAGSWNKANATWGLINCVNGILKMENE